MKKKVLIVLVTITGISFLLGATYLWLSPNAELEKGISVIMAILGFLLALGPNIQGWREVFEKEKYTKNITDSGSIENLTGEYRALQDNRKILHQLPSSPRDFTGRRVELTKLTQAIQNGITILEIQGIGGVGKTVLGLKIAEKLISNFLDAQIFIDLRGVSAEGQRPRSAEEVMSLVIRWFQPQLRVLPLSKDELKAKYFSSLHNKNVLLFFDNVHSSEQIEQLLPPKNCFLILTSRQTIPVSGAYILNLQTADPTDARLFIHKIAPRIGKADAAAIAKQCGYLPLAMRVAASTLITRPDWEPSILLGKLRNRQIRLSLVKASLSLSYDLLDKEAKWRFRQLSFFKWYLDKTQNTLEKERVAFINAVRYRLGLPLPNQKSSAIAKRGRISESSSYPQQARELETETRDILFGRDYLSFIWDRSNFTQRIYIPISFSSFYQVESVSFRLKRNVKRYLRYYPETDESVDATLALLLRAGLIEFDAQTSKYKMHDLTALFCEELVLQNTESLRLSYKLRAYLDQRNENIAAEQERIAEWFASYHRRYEQLQEQQKTEEEEEKLRALMNNDGIEERELMEDWLATYYRAADEFRTEEMRTWK